MTGPEIEKAIETALPPGAPAAAVVDLAAIRHNVASLGARAGAPVMAVVKADAYGHGLLPCARAAVEGGATWLGVAQLAEALELRRAGITAPVLAWLTVPGDAFAEAVERGVDLAVSAPWALAEIAAAARATGRTARIQLKVDTGLNRNGVTVPDFPDLLEAALKLEAEEVVRVAGLFSHYAWADAPRHPTVARQTDLFTEAVALAEARGARLEVRHLANSAATLTNPAASFDLVRPGLAVYGLSPAPDLGSPADFDLRPAMSLLARVANVKGVAAGEGISYGHAYTTTADTRAALLPVGYADGLPRHAVNEGPAWLGGRRYRIAGRVCMDQVVLDLGRDHADTAEVSVGDVAILFGDGPSDGTGVPTAQDWAEVCGTINYEIVTRIGARVPRLYLNEGAR
ncbi:alanine racemase [Spongisporangium articulatum]|uniref:Alanine racemase n=1 Tax=Spongisporangium articulatum TaxID=3362603 RepID=A0ABW8AP59_9ACTN